MDQIAAAANVSKQTVYKQFSDKQQLLYDIVLGHHPPRRGDSPPRLRSMFDEIVDLEDGLEALARRYTTRRPAPRGPATASTRRQRGCPGIPISPRPTTSGHPGSDSRWWSSDWVSFTDRGLLRIDDVPAAASQLAYLILGPLIDRAMFLPEQVISDSEIDYWATAGVSTFVRAYGVAPTA